MAKKQTAVHFQISTEEWGLIDKVYNTEKAKLPLEEQIGFSKTGFQRKIFLEKINSINIENTEKDEL